MPNIAIYPKGTTDFFSQGFGILSDVIYSTTTETASTTGNVSSKLEMQYPVDGHLSNKLIEGNFIRVSMSKDSNDYAIYEITDSLKEDTGTLTIYGDPYSDRIGRMSFEHGGEHTVKASASSILESAIGDIKDFPSWFKVTTNLSKVIDISKNSPYENLSKLLDEVNTKVSGKIKYGVNYIQIYSDLGTDRTDIILRDDMNTTSVKIKTDYSKIVNRIIPLISNKDEKGNITEGTHLGKIISSNKPNEFIDYWAGSVIKVDSQDEANTYFNRTHVDRPVQTVTVVPISYDANLSTVRLFDRLTVYSTKLKFSSKLRVSERVIDNLTGEVTSFKLGDTSPSIVKTITERNEQLFNQVQEISNTVISANHKNTTYHGNAEPTVPIEGDLWYKEEDGETYLQIYQNGEWIDVVSTKTQKLIKDSVDQALLTAHSDAAEMDKKNADSLNEFEEKHSEDMKATSEALDLAANSAANEGRLAAADAKKYADGVASKALSDANTALTIARSDIDISISQAKSEAIESAKVADGLIHQEVTSTADSINLTISQNKSEADGKISKAQTDATQALDGLNAKVSKTDYDKKTGDLDKAVGSAALTADSAALSITKYQSTADGKFNSQSAAIDANSTAISAKVSQTVYDLNNQRVSDKLAEFEQRADGFDLTVKKVDNLSIGDRNYVLDTGNPKVQISNGNSNQDLYNSAKLVAPLNMIAKANEMYELSFDYELSVDLSVPTNVSIFFNQSPWYEQRFTVPAHTKTGNFHTFVKIGDDILNANPAPTVLTFRIQKEIPSGEKITYSSVFMKKTTVPTTWTPAPEDTDNALTVQQTAISANADAIKLKASQTDFDKAKDEYDEQISNIDVKADKISESVTKLTGKVNELGQINQLFNTEFSPDMQGWYEGQPSGLYSSDKHYSGPGKPLDQSFGYMVQGGAYGNSNSLRLDLPNSVHSFHQDLVPVFETTSIAAQIRYVSFGVNSTVSAAIYLMYYDGQKNYIGQDAVNSPKSEGTWGTIQKFVKAPKYTRYVSFTIMTNGSIGTTHFAQPMMVFDTKIGQYTQGPYNNNSAIQTLREQTSDSFKQEVEDRKTGDSTTLSQSKEYVSLEIKKSESGTDAKFKASSDMMYAAISKSNLIANSEFDPTNVGWLKFTNSIGFTPTETVNLNLTGSFSDWAIKGGSRLMDYSDKQWIISELAAVNGYVMSASVIAGRVSVPGNVVQALDIRIGYFDVNKKLIGSNSMGNPINVSTYKGLQLYKLENMKPTAGTRYAGLIIAHSGPATDVITQPMLCYGPKALPYSPRYGNDSSSTIIQLQKDNWAIGITNNIGNLINGINGDGSNVRIAAKKLIIDQDVTIGGTGWLNGAVIKKASIGSAQIGQIDASDGRIINLDVKYLSGDSTNFIKSKWKSAFTNVDITGDGMSIGAGRSSITMLSDGIHMAAWNSVTNKTELVGGLRMAKLNTKGNDYIDYLTLLVDGYETLGSGQNAVNGGDGFAVAVSNGKNNDAKMKLSWESERSAKARGVNYGWNFWDPVTFRNPYINVPGAYQGLRIENVKHANGTIYPAIVGEARGVGILFGSTELYLMRNNRAYALGDILTGTRFNI